MRLPSPPDPVDSGPYDGLSKVKAQFVDPLFQGDVVAEFACRLVR